MSETPTTIEMALEDWKEDYMWGDGCIAREHVDTRRWGETYRYICMVNGNPYEFFYTVAGESSDDCYADEYDPQEGKLVKPVEVTTTTWVPVQ